MSRQLIALGVVQSYLVGWVLHYQYLADGHEHAPGHAHGIATENLSPFWHFMRDSTLAVPAAIVVLLVAALLVRVVLSRLAIPADSVLARIGFALVAAVGAAVASVPEVLIHGWLFGEQPSGALGPHLTGIALLTLRYTFALTLCWVLLFGVPWLATTPFRSSPLATGGSHAH